MLSPELDDPQESTILAGDERLELLNRLLSLGSVPEPDESVEDLPEDASDTLPDDLFIVVFALFCNLFGITRAAYKVFVSITGLASADSLVNLPKSFITLKKWAFSRLPKMRIHSKDIEVVTMKLPAGPPKSFEPEVKMYYFSKLEYLQWLLCNPVTHRRMYFGLQQLPANK